MSGTHEGGVKASEANKANNPDFYKDLGKMGGSVPHPSTRYFFLNRDVAKSAGKKGGTISRKNKKGVKMEPDLQAIDESLWEKYVEWCKEAEVVPRLKHYQVWLDEHFD